MASGDGPVFGRRRAAERRRQHLVDRAAPRSRRSGARRRVRTRLPASATGCRSGSPRRIAPRAGSIETTADTALPDGIATADHVDDTRDRDGRRVVRPGREAFRATRWFRSRCRTRSRCRPDRSQPAHRRSRWRCRRRRPPGTARPSAGDPRSGTSSRRWWRRSRAGAHGRRSRRRGTRCPRPSRRRDRTARRGGARRPTADCVAGSNACTTSVPDTVPPPKTKSFPPIMAPARVVERVRSSSRAT